MKAKLTARTVNALKPTERPFEVFDTEIKGFLLRVEPTGVMTYYLAYKNKKGQRRRYRIERAGTVSPVKARDVAEKRAADIAHGKDIQEEKKKERKEAKLAKARTLKGFLERKYGPWVKANRKTGEATLDRIEFNFSDLMSRPLDEINTWILEKWRIAQRKSGKAVTTINRDVVALKAALSKAVDWGLIEIHPLSDLKPLKTDAKKNVRFLSDMEERSLREVLEGRDVEIKNKRSSANEWRRKRGYELFPDLQGCMYADHLTPMVLLTLNTGLRRGEVFDLTWHAINFTTKILTIVGEKAKSGQSRHIPLNEEALIVLKAWKDQGMGHGLVFPGKDGKRLDNVRKSWGGVLGSAGIKNFRWHDLRHDFASKLVMAGVPLNTVRELLGHADLTTTLRYAHLGPDHKADAVALLGR